MVVSMDDLIQSLKEAIMEKNIDGLKSIHKQIVSSVPEEDWSLCNPHLDDLKALGTVVQVTTNTSLVDVEALKRIVKYLSIAFLWGRGSVVGDTKFLPKKDFELNHSSDFLDNPQGGKRVEAMITFLTENFSDETSAYRNTELSSLASAVSAGTEDTMSKLDLAYLMKEVALIAYLLGRLDND